MSARKGPSNARSPTAYATGGAYYVNKNTKQVIEAAFVGGFDGTPRNRHERRRQAKIAAKSEAAHPDSAEGGDASRQDSGHRP